MAIRYFMIRQKDLIVSLKKCYYEQLSAVDVDEAIKDSKNNKFTLSVWSSRVLSCELSHVRGGLWRIESTTPKYWIDKIRWQVDND